jgi:hypothetical protein
MCNCAWRGRVRETKRQAREGYVRSTLMVSCSSDFSVAPVGVSRLVVCSPAAIRMTTAPSLLLVSLSRAKVPLQARNACQTHRTHASRPPRVRDWEVAGKTEHYAMAGIQNSMLFFLNLGGVGKVCSRFASLLIGVCLPAGGPFTPCTTSATCTHIPGDAPDGTTMTCGLLGFCKLVPPTTSDTTGDTTVTGHQCSTNAGQRRADSERAESGGSARVA